MNSPTPPTEALARTWNFCVGSDWAGKDPYDGLMATRFPATLLLRSRVGRLALIQGMKHLPVDLRGLLGVPPLQNPKAHALGLESACRLVPVPGWEERAREEARKLAERLLGNATETPHGHGWGYPFHWQSRVFYQPAGTPTVVCTGFVVRALDHARRLFAGDPLEERIAAAMRRAVAFVLHDLNRTEDEHGFCFSYSPLDRSRVVNATLLGAETLARVAVMDGTPDLLRRAEGTIAWSWSRQQEDGGWAYGEASAQRWEDAFHTGFNLLSLRAIREAAEELGLDAGKMVPWERVDRAARHYSANFFDPDGRPWYYRHTPWPTDAHAAAVAVITLLRFRDRLPGAREQAERVLDWTIRHLWLPRKGWFRFQVKRWYRIDIPYIRWVQAWMLRALAEWAAVRHEEGAGGR